VRQARWRKGLLSLRAPVAGRVGQLLAGPDDVVREGAPVALVIDNAPQRATAWIAENAAWRVRAGDAVTLTSTDGQGVKVTGRVRALGGGIVEIPARLQQIPGEPAFGRAAHVDLDAVPEGVLPGQSFEATFHRP
jgi:multidrug resistance efflux pump